MRQPISTGSAMSLHYTLEIIYRLIHVKTLPPLAAIKGEAEQPSDRTQQHSSSHSSSALHSTYIEIGTQDTEPPSTHFPKPRPGTLPSLATSFYPPTISTLGCKAI